MAGWDRVTLANGRVSEINLLRLGLAGSIPAELGKLSGLTVLVLGSNSLTGEIPAELGNLSNLTSLGLAENSLTGEIPAELGKLSNLEVLFLSVNLLTGDIPAELGRLSKLTYVGLNYNRLSGCIPVELQRFNEINPQGPATLAGTPERYDLSACTPTAPTFGGATVANQSYVVGEAIATPTLPVATGGNGTLTYTLSPDLPAGLSFNARTRTLSGTPTSTHNAATYTYRVTDADSNTSATDADSLKFTIAVSYGCAGSTAVGGPEVTSGGLVDDCETLLGSEATLVGSGRALNWDRHTAMANWTGVTLASGRVSEIDLLSGGLAGSIPTKLGRLSTLTKLRLDSNSLTGSIPAELGTLSGLTHIWLDGNSLTGSIPVEFGTLSNLMWLDLGENSLTGSIPSELGSLSALKRLLLDSNSLDGSIPAELGTLSSLTDLHLDSNSLTGCIPLALRGFAGTINPQKNDVNLPVCPGVPELTLAAGSGEITASWTVPAGGTPTGYDVEFKLASDTAWTDAGHTGTATTATLAPLTNGMEYEVRVRAKTATDTGAWSATKSATPEDSAPTFGSATIANQSYVVSEAIATLTLPAATGGHGDLVYTLSPDPPAGLTFTASTRELSGTPTALQSATAYTYTVADSDADTTAADADTLRFTMAVSTYGCPGSAAVGGASVMGGGLVDDCEALLVSESTLVGTGTPLNWDTGLRMAHWNGITLSNDRVSRFTMYTHGLAGSIPPELGNLTGLTYLRFSFNSLTGSIPPELGNLSNLERLSFSYNSLTGSIPPELGKLSRLTRLDIQGNQLSGSIPPELGKLTRLAELRLFYNSLTGSIPPELGDLSSLRTLNFRDNYLTGWIPVELADLSRLTYFWLSGNSLSGCIPTTLQATLEDVPQVGINPQRRRVVLPVCVPTGVSLSVSSSSVAEDAAATEVTVTARLNGHAFRPGAATEVTVAVGEAGDGATEGTDYAVVDDFTVTIPENSTIGTAKFTLTPTNDDLTEGHETLSVEGTATGLPVTGAEVTITDDETPSMGVTLSVSPASVTENGGADTVTVTATLDEDAGTEETAVTVSVGASGTATSGTDYAAVPDFTVTIPAGDTIGTAEFTVTPINDVLAEGDETLSVTGAATGLTVTGTEVTITDDETASTEVTLSVSPSSVGEAGGAATMEVTATLNEDAGAEPTVMTVSVGAAGDAAIEGIDYSDVPDFTLTIPAGDTSGTAMFTLRPTDDALAEGSETLSVSGSAAELTVTGTEATITDDDTASTALTLSVSPSSVAEGGGAATLEVTASLDADARPGAMSVTVAVGAEGDAATEGTDYATVSDVTVTIPGGSTTGTGTFTLTPTDDELTEGDETLTVSATVTGLTVTGTAVTITDDETASTGVTLTVSPTLVAEDAGATTVTVLARLNGAAGTAATPVTVAVGATTDGAAEGTDYATVDDFSMSIAAGNTADTATFTLTPTDDDLAEGSETLSVSGTTTVTGLTVTGTRVTIADDETASTAVTLSVLPRSVAEDADTTTVTVVAELDEDAFPADTTVTVAVGAAADRATEGTDYAAVDDFTMTIAAGNTADTATFTLTPTDDLVAEGSERLSVSGSAMGLTVSDATVTITDDDVASTRLTLSAAPGSVAEDGSATTVTVTVALNAGARVSATPVTVQVGATGDGATEGTDYATVADLAMSIGAGNTADTATFTLTPTDDEVVEGDEGVSVAGTTTVTGLAVTDTEVTLTDDDGSAEVTVGDAAGVEGDTLTFTVTLDKAVQGGLTVTPSFADGTAAEGTDYTGNSAALTFAGGAGETQTFRVATTGDALVEGDETFTVGLTVSGTTAPVTATDTGTGTITNDDVASTGLTLSVAPGSVAEDDTATTVTVTVALNAGARASATPVTVTVGAAGDGATEGTDYATVSDLSMSIGAGNTADTATFTLTPTDDEVVEGDEALSVAGTTTVTGLTMTDTEVTLTDDDGSAAVMVGDATALEGDSLTFTVTLDKAVQGGLTVTPSFAGGTAASTDYTANTTALTFAGTASETQTFKVETTEDPLVEGDETFTVSLAVSGTTAPVTATDTGTGTITNDDVASTGLTLSVSPAEVAEDAGATTVTVIAALNAGALVADTAVTVAVGASGDAATEGTDYGAVDDLAMTIAAGSTADTVTFTLTPTNDAFVEGDETLSVTGSGTRLAVTNTEVTITDDDGSAAVTVEDASANEGDSIAFTVTLDKAVQGGLTVTPSFTDGTATKGTDYTENTTALTFAGTASEAQTIKVATTEDAQIEANETFTVNLAVTGTTAPVTDTATATGTITNDDAVSTGITLSVSPESVDEDAGATTVTVTAMLNDAVRSGATAVTVAVGAAGDAATEGTDYTTVADFTVTIPDGETSGDTTFTLTPTDDEVVEGDETLSVSGTTTVTGLTLTNTEITLEDDDGNAEVTIDDASANEGDSIAFTVTLDKAVQGGLTVTPSFADGTATKGTDYTENTTALTFAGTASETKSFKVATTEDAQIEGNETFTVSLMVSGTTAPVTDTATATGTITNDDAASTGITLSVSPTSVGGGRHCHDGDGNGHAERRRSQRRDAGHGGGGRCW